MLEDRSVGKGPAGAGAQSQEMVLQVERKAFYSILLEGKARLEPDHTSAGSNLKSSSREHHDHKLDFPLETCYS